MTPVRPRLLHLTTADISLVLLLGPQLRAFAEAGYDVIGAAAPGSHRHEVEALGVRFEPVAHATRAMAPVQDLLALVELVRMFRRLRPLIVHTHNPKPGWYGRLAARLAGVPVVVNTVHGLYATPEDRPGRRRLVYGLERLAARFSDAELVQNPEDVDTLRAIGVPSAKVHLLGNGIDLTRFDPEALDEAQVGSLRRELAGGSDDVVDAVVVGVVGRLVWEKGLREAIEAAGLLRSSHPRVRVVVVGPLDPDKADGLGADDLARAGRATRIRFAGERRDMEVVHACFDVFMLATHREGFPRAAMEAAAMGVPAVATDVRGCRQVVDDGVTGLLVPVGDAAALARAVGVLADDEDRRRAMGAAARERALSHFDQQDVIDTTLSTYARLGAGPARSPAPGGPRVLHLIHTTDRRGAEIFGCDLAAGLARRGLPGTTLALRPGRGAHLLPVEALGRWGRTPLTLSRLDRRARGHDVVVGHGASTLLAGSVATLGRRTPFVYRLIGDPRFWVQVPLRRARTTAPLRRAAAVVALWSQAATDVIDMHGLDPSRVHVIANGRDSEHFVPPTAAQRRRARHQLGLPTDGPVVGYLGSLSWEKQPRLALEVARLRPAMTLVMAGDGPLRGDVEADAAAIGPRIVVLGSVADPRTVIWALDALLLTSRTEGMPGVVIEAGLCGVPAVAPDVGGTGDLVSSATGHLLDPASPAEAYAAALDEVLGDAGRRGDRARRLCLSDYTLDTSVRRWSALLADLVS